MLVTEKLKMPKNIQKPYASGAGRIDAIDLSSIPSGYQVQLLADATFIFLLNSGGMPERSNGESSRFSVLNHAWVRIPLPPLLKDILI